MVRKNMSYVISVFVILSVLVVFAQVGETAPYKVLVVMSYHESLSWVQEIQEGIEAVLADQGDVKYVYLDVLRHPEGVDAKAQEVYDMYQAFQPDGVIAADDDAQFRFVVPYVKEKTDTPVIFCGINAAPEQYGYPATNVTGILERMYYQQAIAFVKQLVPSVKTVGAVAKDVPTARGLSRHVTQERETYPVTMLDFEFVDTTLAEALEITTMLKEQSDALFIGPTPDLLDAEGKPLSFSETVPIIVQTFGKPTFSVFTELVQNGALCAVVEPGQEQGRMAAEMLLKAMQGTPLSEMPIAQNKEGKRVLNVTTMKALGIVPKPHILRGVKLVETVK